MGYFRIKGILYAIVLIFIVSACGPLPRFIVLHDPLTPEEHITLGLSYEQKGENDLALGEYKKAMKALREDFRPLFYAGNVYYKKREYNLAEKYYNRALKIAPDNGDVHNNLAWVYMDTGKYDAAVREAQGAVEITRNAYHLNTLAHVYNRTGRFKEAMDVLREAITMTPEDDKELRDNESHLMNALEQKTGFAE